MSTLGVLNLGTRTLMGSLDELQGVNEIFTTFLYSPYGHVSKEGVHNFHQIFKRIRAKKKNFNGVCDSERLRTRSLHHHKTSL